MGDCIDADEKVINMPTIRVLAKPASKRNSNSYVNNSFNNSKGLLGKKPTDYNALAVKA